MKIYILILSILCLTNTGLSQGSKWFAFRGQNKLKADAFKDAEDLFYKSLDADSTNYKANIGLGQIYLYHHEQYDSAHLYLSRALRNQVKDTSYQNYYDYARCLQMLEQPAKAINYYSLCIGSITDNQDENEQSLDADLINSNIKDSETAVQSIKDENTVTSVRNLGYIINSINSEYTPVIMSQNELLMYNGRYKDNDDEKLGLDNKYLENIYYYTPSESTISAYDRSSKQETHGAIVSSIGNNDSILIYYKNALHFSSITNQRFNQSVRLPRIISNYYHQPHGMFNTRKDTFIFSAKKTKEDDLDIYITYKENGEWAVPSKIEGGINTSFDEDSPLLSKDGKTIYFSSKGHNGNGGYDIFKSTYTADGWTPAENLGYPLNSAGDDIFFTLTENEKAGYLSSNRTGGFGRMDIYSFDLFPTPTFDCPKFESEDLMVALDISESISTPNLAHTYNWNFNDGEVLTGTKINKTFSYPGEQQIRIDIIDPVSGNIDSTIVQIINIEAPNYIGYTYTQNNDNVLFDAGLSQLQGNRVLTYHWMLEDTSYSEETPLLNYTFKQGGEQTVKLQVDVLSDDEIFETYCYSEILSIIKIDPETGDTLIGSDNSDLALEDTNNGSGTENNDEGNNSTAGDGESDNSGSNADSGSGSGSENDNGNTTSEDIDNTNSDNGNSDTAENAGNDNSDGVTQENLDGILIDMSEVGDFQPNPIYFGFDKSNIDSKARTNLDSIVDYMKENTKSVIVISGHTDSKGDPRYNLRLSSLRSKSAVNYLVKNGISKDRIIKVINLGETQPAVPNELENGKDNVNGRKLNRRVNFLLYKSVPKE